MRFQVGKVDTNKLINVPTSLNSLKAKVDDLDIDKLKTVAVDVNNIKDVVSKEVVRKRVFSKINAKNRNFGKKLLIHLIKFM